MKSIVIKTSLRNSSSENELCSRNVTLIKALLILDTCYSCARHQRKIIRSNVNITMLSWRAGAGLPCPGLKGFIEFFPTETVIIIIPWSFICSTYILPSEERIFSFINSIKFNCDKKNTRSFDDLNAEGYISLIMSKRFKD